MLAPAKTRWLSLLKCVERVYDQWDVLKELFKVAVFEDKNAVADIIYREFNNPFVKAYLAFLKFILPLFNEFNMLFQSEKVLFPVIARESRRFIKRLCAKFVERSFLDDENFVTLNVRNSRVLLPSNKIQLGADTLEILSDCSNSDREQFINKCLTFYHTFVEEAIKRFPVKEA